MNANFVSNTVKSRFSGAKTAPLAVRVFTTLGLTLACEQQTHFRSSLLSLVFSGVGMLVGKIKPLKETNLGVAEAFFDP